MKKTPKVTYAQVKHILIFKEIIQEAYSRTTLTLTFSLQGQGLLTQTASLFPASASHKTYTLLPDGKNI